MKINRIDAPSSTSVFFSLRTNLMTVNIPNQVERFLKCLHIPENFRLMKVNRSKRPGAKEHAADVWF